MDKLKSLHARKDDYYYGNILFLLIALILNLFINNNLKAQSSVPTTPHNKNFLIERGTGHTCGSCPHITLRCDSVIDSHSGRGILIEYHFGPDAVPQISLPVDYRTPYGDSILHWPFYLNMMINRRDQGPPYGSTFIFSPSENQIKKEADLVVTQPSDVNLAMTSNFNSTTRLLTVNVEVYYTANSATALNFIQIAITEDSLISMQYDGDYIPNNHFNPNFNHMNVFRANMNGFWGDSVKTTTQGTLISRTYYYTLPTSPYKWNSKNCKLTLYVTENKNSSGIQSFAGKIITAIRTDLEGNAPVSITDQTIQGNTVVYPNPTSGVLYLKRNVSGYYHVEVIDILGKTIYTSNKMNLPETNIDLSLYKKGTYLVKIYSENEVSTFKILVN